MGRYCRVPHSWGEPLKKEFTPEYLWAKSRLTRRAVKDFLMDQKVVAGIGNIYANEILFRAGVRPARRASGLKKRQVERVVIETRAVLREAIRYRGSSISDYLDGQGRKGSFQKRFVSMTEKDSHAGYVLLPLNDRPRAGVAPFFALSVSSRGERQLPLLHTFFNIFPWHTKEKGEG